MNLSQQQIAFLHKNMKELVATTERQEAKISVSIRRTNIVIVSMSIIGILLVLLTLLMFNQFSRSVTHSIKSMDAINEQVSAFQETMTLVEGSMQSMGKNIEFLSYMNMHVAKMSGRTKQIGINVSALQAETTYLARDAGELRLNTQYIDQQFGRINNSIGRVSGSLHDIAKPARQFFPVP